MRIIRSSVRASFLLVVISQLGATDCGEVIRDPGFDLWCGESLCSWKVVRGDTRRVDTWHAGDSGVELLGDDAAIAQLSPVDGDDAVDPCILFEMIADVEDTAQAELGFDAFGDGSIEHAIRIPTSHWEQLSFKVHLPKTFTGMRFELSKKGHGRAVFAHIDARLIGKCEGLPLVAIGPAPLGAYCSDDANCASAKCRWVGDGQSLFGTSQRCVACDETSCGPGEVCGVAEPVSPVLLPPVKCVLAGVDELGEQCERDAECASGVCFGNACSACRAESGSTCANAEVCGEAWPNGAWVCSPKAGVRTSGEACGTDADCASGHCNGALRDACKDNRPCGNDTNCPVEHGLVPGTCTTVGVQGGSCS